MADAQKGRELYFRCGIRRCGVLWILIGVTLVLELMLCGVYFYSSGVDRNKFTVLWYNDPPYLRNRPNARAVDFSNCVQQNCHLTFDRKHARNSNAIIFDGRNTGGEQAFPRPQDQIWIFWAHECPTKMYDIGSHWTKEPWNSGYNWTMTYNRQTDVYLPYGELIPFTPAETKNYTEIALAKTKTGFWISSNCNTPSKRETYVSQLQLFIDIDVAGECSSSKKPWTCGTKHLHDQDDCFSILNDYKFFFAFENSLCQDYYTEKYFENYEFDTVLVIRGGLADEHKLIFPEGTYISASDFKNAKDLGNYLKALSDDVPRYAAMLKRKSRYKSVLYKHLYERALCNICDRLNYIEEYKSTYRNISHWVRKAKYCRSPQDLLFMSSRTRVKGHLY